MAVAGCAYGGGYVLGGAAVLDGAGGAQCKRAVVGGKGIGPANLEQGIVRNGDRAAGSRSVGRKGGKVESTAVRADRQVAPHRNIGGERGGRGAGRGKDKISAHGQRGCGHRFR